MVGLLKRLKATFSGSTKGSSPQSENDVYATRLARRKHLIGVVTKALPAIRFLLYLVGYTWMALIPLQHLSKRTWIDENALQPGQVTTYWSWGDVHTADRYLADIDELLARNATSAERASYVENQFIQMGLKTETQAYHIRSSVKDIDGVNAYAVYPVPRASGAEAIVISASWVSRSDEGTTMANRRGVAFLLALAKYLSKYSLWAKDLVFVVNDGYTDGMHAWLNAYHGIPQENMDVQPLTHISGVIWTALCIDYPGHSFSHLGIFYEGLNGRLPNQDLVNSVTHIARYTGGVPVVLYDHVETSAPTAFESYIGSLPIFGAFRNAQTFKDYFRWAENVKRHVQYEALNRGSGVHGLFHKFRIDAITVFAVPAMGPYGFHTIGQIVESSLRTMNNLLERLHASFFFYVLTSPLSFVNFGGYLASAILVSVTMIFGGLRLWVVAGWTYSTAVELVEPVTPSTDTKHGPQLWPVAIPQTRWRRRERPVLKVLAIMLATHLFGWVLFKIITTPLFGRLLEGHWYAAVSGLSAVALSFPFLPFLPYLRQHLRSYPPPSYHPARTEPQAPLYLILKAFNLYISSIVISITSVLNFSLAASLAVLLGIPLNFSRPRSPLAYALLWAVSPTGLMSFATTWVGRDHVSRVFTRTVWEWEVLGAWFLPFVCVVYLPLVLQGMIVCTLPRE